MKKTVECGAVTAPHGIKGEVRVSGDPELLTRAKRLYLGEGETLVRVLSARPHKNVVIVRLAGIDSADEAERLRGVKLYALRDDITLPEGVYFTEDVIGLSVFDREGKCYGKITDIFRAGSSDVYTATDDNGKSVMFPAVAESEIEIDLEKGRLTFTPMEGLFD